MYMPNIEHIIARQYRETHIYLKFLYQKKIEKMRFYNFITEQLNTEQTENRFRFFLLLYNR